MICRNFRVKNNSNGDSNLLSNEFETALASLEGCRTTTTLNFRTENVDITSYIRTLRAARICTAFVSQCALTVRYVRPLFSFTGIAGQVSQASTLLGRMFLNLNAVINDSPPLFEPYSMSPLSKFASFPGPVNPYHSAKRLSNLRSSCFKLQDPRCFSDVFSGFPAQLPTFPDISCK
jgi:hypothetical protein